MLDLVKGSEAAMDAAGRELQVRTFVEQVWNGKNYAAVSDLYAENYANPFGTGPAARAEPIRRYHQAFPDLRFDIEELIVADGTVVLRAAFRGTDTGGYAGRAATGRAVDAWVVTIMHFDGDRVVREWIGADNLGLFIQLGVVDNPWPS
jgi:predicted ester cyclase